MEKLRNHRQVTDFSVQLKAGFVKFCVLKVVPPSSAPNRFPNNSTLQKPIPLIKIIIINHFLTVIRHYEGGLIKSSLYDLAK